jgi:hypothetical protein
LERFVAPAAGAVVKLNHQAGSVTILKPNSSLSAKQMELYRRKIDESYSGGTELHYTFVRHGVIVEEFLPAMAGVTGRPPDIKAYAFDGNISLVRIIQRQCQAQHCTGTDLILYPFSFLRSPFSTYVVGHRDFVGNFSKPCGWQQAMQTVQCLSHGINFARIDVYIVNCETFLGEMTMTPNGGNQENVMAAEKYMAGFLKSWDIYPRGPASALF